MGFLQGGAFRLFRVAGIDVFLHWTWFLIAMFVVESGHNDAKATAISAAVYVTLFGIVLLHEFGHAFACRSVGGLAERIILWPLGGIAFASPPPRAGAVLWTIAAGPLVNVALIPVTFGTLTVLEATGWGAAHPDFMGYLREVTWLNAGLLFFNLIPVYPLDGGQIMQSLLWFVVGRANSLRIAGAIGVVIGGLTAVAMVYLGQWFGMVMAMFVTLQAWNGLQQGNLLHKLDALPRRHEVHCPNCHESPFIGELWLCQGCRQPYDIFARHGLCPRCGHQARHAPCPHCGRLGPIGAQRDGAVEATLV